jgi:hypothetical protein
MDDKTEDLRDLFVSVTDSESVTEARTEGHGSLAGDEEAEAAALLDVVAALREEFDLTTDLDDAVLATVVRAFYRGADDEAIAATADLPVERLRQARLACHLFREDDAERAANGDIDADALERARERARAVSYRFQSAYADAIPDAELARNHVEGVHEDGLEEAAEDIETDISF